MRIGKIASVSDDGNPAKIQPSEINLLTEPDVPEQDHLWLDISGTSPTRVYALKIFDNGAWVTLFEVTY